MTLILLHTGRGNSAIVMLQLAGRRAALPLEVRVGQRVVLAGQTFRIAEVRP